MSAAHGGATESSRLPGLLVESFGVLLLAVTVCWLWLAAEASGGDATPMIALLTLAAAAFAVARTLTRVHGWAVPAAVAAAAAGLAVWNHGTLLGAPIHNPFGYSNAVGSFYTVATAAALMVASRSPRAEIRAVCLLAALAFAAIPWLNGTRTAALLACALPLAFLFRRRAVVRSAIVAGALIALTGHGIVLLIGATYQPADRSGRVALLVDGTLSERRAELWHDAIVLIAERPLAGVGPNRFPLESPTARKDPDTIWPHNEVLHFGAEAGVPGLILLVGLFGWGFVRLYHGPGDVGTGIAALALTSTVVHASVDYVLHFPAVAAAAAALVGAGSTMPRVRVRRRTRSVPRGAREVSVAAR